MLSTFIIENMLAVRVALGAAVALCIALGFALLRDGRRGRRIGAVLAGIAVLVVLAITLLPDTNPNPEIGCKLESFSPLDDEWNILLFVFPTLFAVVASRRPVLVALGAAALSAAIELVQAVTPALGRRCDLDDWLTNCTGAAIGVAIGVVLMLLDRWRQARAHSKQREMSSSM